MEKYWIARAGNDRLIVFVLGWAADHSVVAHIKPDGYDVLAIYDYRAMEPVGTELERYSEKYLFAWSFGVWAAEQLLAGVGFARAVAFNGTPFPVSDTYGIAPRRLDTTIRGLHAGGMEPFEKRAYGASYEIMAKNLSPRPLEDNIAELETLRRRSTEPYRPEISWDRAVIGSGDVIFPPENMRNYWSVRAEVLPLPHYPFADAEIILRELEDKQTTC